MTRWNNPRRLLSLALGLVCVLFGVALIPFFGWHESASAGQHQAEEKKSTPLDAD